jgi:ankyrin repeat protein
VEILLKHGANVLMKDNTGSLPIHIACSSNHVSIARMLLNSRHAKKTLLERDGHGKTARQLCATKFLRTLVEGWLIF